MLNTDNINALKAALLARVKGMKRPGWKCCCGAINKPESEVIEVGVYPAAEYQVDMPSMWTARLTNNWSLTITEFLPKEEVEALFAQHRPLYTPDASN